MEGVPVLSDRSAVVIRAERIAAGDQSGCAARNNAAMPLTCGQAIDVPDIMLNFTRLLSALSSVGAEWPVQAARILTPGATMSGFKISDVNGFGPRDENAATTGARVRPTTVLKLNDILASGCAEVLMYLLMAFAACAPTMVAGRIWESAVRSSPLAASLPRIMPTPPAARTVRPFSTRLLMPLSQKMIFPRAWFKCRPPGRQKRALVLTESWKRGAILRTDICNGPA
eukprot:TRINITY_DN3706_c0_g1_i1.p2 TRINITY_DN3706_c0_g1~~TRINITY_DN3706_c0_g1_i1.p2  ORF type:complete len:228 (-),score=-2.02 TRINITY_DN3706_c0_g1_i1:1122-1805(-)